MKDYKDDLSYFHKTISWLLEQPEVDSSLGVGITGVSLGGYIALMVNYS